MVCDPSKSTADYSDSETEACKIECTKDSDCEEGEICEDSKCKAEPECSEDKKCEEGYACVEGHCQIIPECRENSECESGVCENGKCKPTTECQDDDECGEGEECFEGECRSALECREDAECGEGEECSDGKCKQMPVPDCKSDAECPGQVCVNGKCVDPVLSETLAGAGCNCSAVGVGGRSVGSLRATGLLSLMGLALAWARRRRTKAAPND